MKTLFTTCFLVILISLCAESVHSQTGPTLLKQENSSRGAVLDSVIFVRDPVPFAARHNFSGDGRTRIALFGANLDLLPQENASAVTATARDSKSRTYSLNVEFVGKVPEPDWLTQVVVRLPDPLPQSSDVWISVSLRGQVSNEVLVNIDPPRVTLPARRIINGHDNFADACFSFEFGTNGQAAVPLTLNDWDLLFGNTPGIDTFDVTLAGDDRSRIQDLGALNWSDEFQVPVVTPHPVPTNGPDTDVHVGHIYVVHTKDSNSDLYALFRVESLDPGKSVTISWKVVPSPEN
ncbi:MAG TPA: hypothetical protein VFS77_16185 [Pyrinomonadaceae bacterium]|nr:hypothetical protein [Pyrinomonadaceae bacterium]